MTIRFQNGGIAHPPRSGIPESIHLRQPSAEEVPPIDEIPARYFALGLVHLKQQIGALAKMIEDRSRPVDEYAPQTLTPESTGNLTFPAQWEVPEIIESIVVTGPAGTITLQLGDRTWNLVIPAAQILVIAPIRLILSRSDNRVLTAATPGQYNLELMGHCDDRAG